MGITSPKNNKDSGKGNKQTPNNAQGSKFIVKPGKTSPFVRKKVTTGSRRGS